MTAVYASGRRHLIFAPTYGMLLICAAVLAGCANPNAGSAGPAAYRSGQGEQIARNGTVISVRAIFLNEERVATHTDASSGSDRSLSQVGGAILGTLSGDTTEDHTGQTDGYEIVVRLDNGEIRSVAQESDVLITLKQRVQVLSGPGATRVSPLL